MTETKSELGIVVAQVGSRMHYAVPRILQEAGRLARLYTDICASSGFIPWFGFLPAELQPKSIKKLLGRNPRGIPQHKIRDFKRQSLCARAVAQKARSKAAVVAHNHETARGFCQSVVRSGLEGASGVYAFKSAALEIFEHAREQGILTLLDQTGALTETYWRMSAEEEARYPGWQPRGAAGTPELEAYCAREKRERELADRILCPSEYVIETLSKAGVNPGKCELVPYGYDATAVEEPCGERNPSSTLRVLLVGSVRLEKGIQYALEAAKRLGRGFEFRAVGDVHLLPEGSRLVKEKVELTGQVPWTELAQHYRWADILLFPTLSDSFGLVQLEAMAHGLPVITTPHAGKVVRDGTDGFIVPIRDAEAIAQKLEHLAANRDKLTELSRAALERITGFDMKSYGKRLLSAIPTPITKPR